MIKDLNFPVEVVGAPIVREQDGLAMSSRNTYLSKQERKNARCLSRGLQKARHLFQKGEKNAEDLKKTILAEVESTPCAQADYVEIVDLKRLEPITKIDCPSIILIAVRIGNTRLLDNILLDGEHRDSREEPCARLDIV